MKVPRYSQRRNVMVWDCSRSSTNWSRPCSKLLTMWVGKKRKKETWDKTSAMSLLWFLFVWDVSQMDVCRKTIRAGGKGRVGQHWTGLEDSELEEPGGRWQWKSRWWIDELQRALGTNRCTKCWVGWKVWKSSLLARIRPAFSELFIVMIRLTLHSCKRTSKRGILAPLSYFPWDWTQFALNKGHVHHQFPLARIHQVKRQSLLSSNNLKQLLGYLKVQAEGMGCGYRITFKWVNNSEKHDKEATTNW